MEPENIRQLLWHFRDDTKVLDDQIAHELKITPETLANFLYDGVSINDATLSRIQDYLQERYRERDEAQHHFLKGLYDQDDEIQPQAEPYVCRRFLISAKQRAGRSNKQLTQRRSRKSMPIPDNE